MIDSKNLTEPSISNADVLDHAAEFVDRVAKETPAEYSELVVSPWIQSLLTEDNAFNRGKLYAWAEYRVFRREFESRFPEATPQSCINAFCKLFLKNDISLSNLVHALERPTSENLALLRQRRRPSKKPAR